MGFFKRLLRRLSQDESDRRAETISGWAATIDGTVRIAEAQPRTVVRVAGVVEGVRVRPREGIAAIEATVTDGTGRVTAVWLGRRSLSGLTLGTRLVLEGMLGGEPEHLQLMNPTYDFSARAED